jgi:hypothetical protein
MIASGLIVLLYFNHASNVEVGEAHPGGIVLNQEPYGSTVEVSG